MSGRTESVSGTVVRTTDAAVLVEIDGSEKWIPFSIMIDCSDDNPERGDDIDVTVPQWWAAREGL